MPEASDEDLMVRVARGDEAAFHMLTQRHAGRSIGLARRITGNAADAEEIVQEALLRVWVNAPRWRPVAAFRTWLYRMVVNLSLNRRRHAPFVPIEAAGDPVDPADDPRAAMENAEIDRRLAAAVAALSARQRAAVTLTYGEGLSNAETATVMGTSVSGVETLLVRARRSLRATLATLLE
jgi:RNA polymerase sigma-70 factor (ECF subfamily)